MEFLYLLEKLRVPVLDEFMLTITHLGEETAFLVIALWTSAGDILSWRWGSLGRSSTSF